MTISTVERRRDTRQTDEGTVGRERYVYRLVVRFRYEYDGETHESGNKSYNMPFGDSSESRAKETAQQHPEKKSHRLCRREPGRGLEVDERRQNAGAFFLGVIGVFTTLIGLMGGLMFALLTFVV